MSTTTAIAFVVPGIPVPQGSKMPWGGEANPHVRAWRESVARAAALTIDEPLHGAVEVEVEYVFPRPKSHYRTGKHAHELRATAPHWHVNAPDLDKLQRAIGDALKGTVLFDDRQIASWIVTKRYGTQPRAEVAVRELT